MNNIKEFHNKLLSGNTDHLSEGAKRELKKLREATDAIESHFVKQLLKEIKYVGADGKKNSTQGDFAMDHYKQAIADSMSEHGIFGFSDLVYESYEKQFIQQELARQIKERSEKELDGNDEIAKEPIKN